MDERRRAHNSTLKQSRKPMSKVSDRRPREWARAYGSDERVAWVRSLACRIPDCGRPSENAHTRTGGTGRKADADTILNLCDRHHRELHAEGPHVFERLHGIDLAHEASLLDERWRLRSEDDATTHGEAP